MLEEECTKYVAWCYEEGASPPCYHIYSLDNQPNEFNLQMTIFTINCKQTNAMDARIQHLTNAIDDVITVAIWEMENGKE